MSQKLRVLFVEDSDEHVQLVVHLLKTNNYLVEYQRVESEQEMRNALQTPWDLILSDYSMPGFSGVVALEIYHDFELDIPFILVSGTVGEETAVNMLKSGAHDYIMKDKINLIIPSIDKELKEYIFRKEREGIAAEWIRLQKELQESEIRFRSAFENAPIGMELISLDGKLMRVNSAFCELVGYNKEELGTANFRDFTHPDDLVDNENYVQQLIIGEKENITFEKRYIRKDGNTIWVNVSASMFRNTLNEPQYFIAQVEDITQRKEVIDEIMIAKNMAEESDRLKTALLSNMSHELRTPMNGILGFTELIMNSGSQEDVKDMARMIDISGKRLLQTLDSIILLAQLQSGTKTLAISSLPVCLSDEAKFVAKTMADKARDKGLDYIVEIQSDVFAHAEPKLLRNALLILLDNAIKFTQTGFVKVTLSTAVVDNEPKAIITIQDTGIGVPEKYQETIFEEFRQVSEGFGRCYEGIGIGLSITKRIVELFNGKISVKSAAEIGSTFTIELPVCKETVDTIPEIADLDEATHITQLPSSTADIRILVVEDNLVNTKLLIRYLKDYCEAIDSTTTGEAAVDLAKTNAYDAILMDINLGAGIDGLQATQLIRQLKGYQDTPIIAVTGYTMIGDEERMLSGGCSRYIGKPFSQNVVINVLQDVLPNLRLNNLNRIQIDQSQRVL